MIKNDTFFLIDVSLLLIIFYEVFISDRIFILPSIISIINKLRKNKKNKK